MPRKNSNPLKPKPGPLENATHEHFAQLVAQGETQANASIKAGFTGKNSAMQGNRLANKEHVKYRIREIKELSSDRAIMGLTVSKSWVLKNLKEITDRAMQAVPVLDKEGNATGEWRFDGSVANRAVELVGKELGMFVDRKVIGLQDLRTASADDLYSLLAELDSIVEAKQLTEGPSDDDVQATNQPTKLSEGE